MLVALRWFAILLTLGVAVSAAAQEPATLGKLPEV
jgi:hypothetical protein